MYLACADGKVSAGFARARKFNVMPYTVDVGGLSCEGGTLKGDAVAGQRQRQDRPVLGRPEVGTGTPYGPHDGSARRSGPGVASYRRRLAAGRRGRCGSNVACDFLAVSAAAQAWR